MPLNAFQRIQTELAQVFEQLPEASVTQTAQAIRTHPRIFVSAAGRSGLMLKAFAMRLTQAGFTAYAAGETTTPAIGPGDLLIVASASGQTPSVCRNAEIARAAGADLWVISGKDASPGHNIHILNPVNKIFILRRICYPYLLFIYRLCLL